MPLCLVILNQILPHVQVKAQCLTARSNSGKKTSVIRCLDNGKVVVLVFFIWIVIDTIALKEQRKNADLIENLSKQCNV